MKVLILIWIIVNVFSCGQLSCITDNELSKKDNKKEHTTTIISTDTIQLKLSKNIENVIIEYWDNYYANSFIFEVKNKGKGVEVNYRGETLFKKRKTLTELITLNHLIGYINQFYIDKEVEIVLKRTKRDYIESTDYPNIKVIGYQRGKKIFSTKTQIGEEDYDVEYNPQFMEFYQLLDSLARDNR